ncbi:MAG: branched-chain amino acid ABC transporter permease [Xenococcaceae cyanobacterium MO_207.B15]|nr:branched-chain amino acid ABC transporter permease [Xenococcaceae cyanobacterium MO_207.B15]
MDQGRMWSQILLNALIAGSTYSLVGIGFSLIFSPARFFHMAHGGIITVAGYLVYAMAVLFKLNHSLSIFIALFLAAILGSVMELLVFRRLRQQKGSGTIQLIASLGILVVLQNLISLVFGDDVMVLNPGVVKEGLQIGAARITDVQLGIVLTNIVVFLLISFLLHRTKIGWMIRAVTDDAELAQIFGISVELVILLPFFIGSAIAGIAGILIAYDIGLTPLLGFQALFMGVVAAISGGITSPTGTMLAGLLLGIIMQISAWLLPTQWQEAIAFTILLLFLLLRPQGLLGKPLRSKKV